MIPTKAMKLSKTKQKKLRKSHFRANLKVALALGGLTIVLLPLMLSSNSTPNFDQQHVGLRGPDNIIPNDPELEVNSKQSNAEISKNIEPETTSSSTSSSNSVSSFSLNLNTSPRSRTSHHVHYFAYASDLLLARLIKGGTTSAVKVSNAQAPDFTFDYSIYSDVWKGGVADLRPRVKRNEEAAWGVVYKMKESDLLLLDKQKGLGSSDPKYERFYLTVKTSRGDRLNVISYAVRENKRMTEQQLPSVQYRACIVKGALSNRLPKTYVAFLADIQDNGNEYKRKSVGRVCD